MKPPIRSLLAGLAAAALAFAGCSGTTEPTKTTEAAGAYPMSFTNCDHEVTIPAKPGRIITLNGHVTETITALGAGDRIVGITWAGSAGDNWLPELADEIKKMPVLSEKYPTWEQMLEADPDLIIGGMNSSFNEKEGRNRTKMHDAGMATYKFNEYCGEGFKDMSLVYDDITMLGKILDLPDEAAALNTKIKEPLDTLQQALKDAPATPTFFYDSGEDEAFTVGGIGAGHVIADLAHVKNLTDDGEKPYVKVPWEQVAEMAPEFIVILDYGDTTAQQKWEFLQNHPLMKETPGVKNRNYVVVPLADMFESQRLVTAAYTIADAAHPDLTPER